MSAPYRARPETAADRPFLRELFASTLERQLARAPFSEQQRQEFLDFQFEAQWRHYHDPEHYGGCRYLVLEVDGQPAGKAYVHPREREIRLVDLAVAPAHRGRGIGTAFLEELQAEAREAGLPLHFMVEHGNPARRLYERCGFTEIAQEELHSLMEWRP